MSISALFSPSEPLKLGDTSLKGRAFLAPMSGISDAPFRHLAESFGASLVVSEMTACPSLARGDKKALERLDGKKGKTDFVVQLAGCEADWMHLGTKIAVDKGADVLDINMGCPARQGHRRVFRLCPHAGSGPCSAPHRSRDRGKCGPPRYPLKCALAGMKKVSTPRFLPDAQKKPAFI